MVEREEGRRAERADEPLAGAKPAGVDDRASASEPASAKDRSEFERAMEIGRKVMKDHHAVLAALAR